MRDYGATRSSLANGPTLLLLAAFSGFATGPAHAKLDAASLHAIAVETRSLCQRASPSGSSTTTRDVAGGGISIGAIIERIGRLGGNVEVKRDRQQEVYNGVLAKDLAASIASYNHCVERTLEVLLQHLDTRTEKVEDARTESRRKAPVRVARTTNRTETAPVVKRAVQRERSEDSRVDVTNLPNYFVYVNNNCSQAIWVSFYYLDSSGKWTVTKFYTFGAKFKNYAAEENGRYLIARSNYMGWYAALVDNSLTWTGSSKDSYDLTVNGTRYTYRGDDFQPSSNNTLVLTTCP